jgi:integrase
MSSKKKCWRKSLGERGLRVYLFEREPGGNLYREVYAGGKRVAAKKSLGHRDRERAIADGYTLLSKLTAREDALRDGKVTLALLFDMYRESPAHHAKKPKTRREDEARLKRMIEFLGPARDVRTLSDSDVERYGQARMRGECGSGRRVSRRSVGADLVALRTALNWATRQRNGRGAPLLDRNPLFGVKLPVEKNPKRPVETFERYLALMEVAPSEDWRLPAALHIVESYGRRIGATLRTGRDDLDLARAPYGWIRFRAEHDKTGHEQWVPLTEQGRQILSVHLASLPDGTPWLFPAERDPSKPVDVSVMSRLLRKAYAHAGLQPLTGGLWHPWRRKWATERKNMPISDVARAGGWRDVTTVLKSYQQADEATVTRVVLDAPKLYSDGVARPAEVTPKATPTLKVI